MRIGLVLPSFTADFSDCRDALDELEDHGFDGAFVYDHLWPMFHRDRPAISAFAALGALSARRRRATLGTLVARVGVVDRDVLVRELVTCYEATDHAFIAGVGTGDRKSREELVGYGLSYAPADSRRAELRSVARALQAHGVPVWVGGGSEATNACARELGVTLNLWGATPGAVRLQAGRGPVSWGGKLPDGPAAAADLLVELHDAGATWAVFSWPGPLDGLAAAREQAGRRLGGL